MVLSLYHLEISKALEATCQEQGTKTQGVFLIMSWYHLPPGHPADALVLELGLNSGSEMGWRLSCSRVSVSAGDHRCVLWWQNGGSCGRGVVSLPSLGMRGRTELAFSTSAPTIRNFDFSSGTFPFPQVGVFRELRIGFRDPLAGLSF